MRYLRYVWEVSLAKTLAVKYKTKVTTIYQKDQVDALIHELQDEAAEVRRRPAAAGQLGGITGPNKSGGTRAIEPLIVVLQDEAPEVRRSAASALGQIGDPRAVEPLIATLQDEVAGYDAAWALGKIGPSAVEPLMAMLKDEDQDIQRGAADALVEIGDPAIEPLTAALEDEDPHVRALATEILEQIAINTRMKNTPVKIGIGKDR
jgi:HEAT repeat protein